MSHGFEHIRTYVGTYLAYDGAAVGIPCHRDLYGISVGGSFADM